MARRLTIKIAVWVMLSGVLAGMAGCGSKKADESAKEQSQAPKDSMQKAYNGGQPGAASQSR